MPEDKFLAVEKGLLRMTMIVRESLVQTEIEGLNYWTEAAKSYFGFEV